ncbi:sulfotransferase family protein [Novosphingobium sp. PhB165]|uniref:sulfotransferase family 2 domain-containing protein n=1 Tax=Novosphingobium sp. PhB165 TaxID=2485105 RepID=UPI00104AA4A5|nr:sulfotransferase family 2 domain-containing protein [Novosphingobium sp. PhB165]TCM19589.1 sulfotransferase family protein [Novosphingobium sp. PhB165]
MATVLETPALDRTAGTTGLNRIIASAFGVRLVSDVPERLSRFGLRPWLDAKRRQRLNRIRMSGLLFIHVPKNAGTSISDRLYGAQTKHASAIYYARAAPDLLILPSFAIVRNPVERFLSAYRYARAGGTLHRTISAPFRERYSGFRSIDDAIDHLAAARSPFDLDHVFRPQSWYLLDASGQLAVDRLIPYERIGEIGRLLRRPDLENLPQFNRCETACELPGRAQLDFLHQFYAHDFALRETALKAGAPLLTP